MDVPPPSGPGRFSRNEEEQHEPDRFAQTGLIIEPAPAIVGTWEDHGVKLGPKPGDKGLLNRDMRAATSAQEARSLRRSSRPGAALTTAHRRIPHPAIPLANLLGSKPIHLSWLKRIAVEIWRGRIRGLRRNAQGPRSARWLGAAASRLRETTSMRGRRESHTQIQAAQQRSRKAHRKIADYVDFRCRGQLPQRNAWFVVRVQRAHRATVSRRSPEPSAVQHTDLRSPELEAAAAELADRQALHPSSFKQQASLG
jgi:hypothetical protein